MARSLVLALALVVALSYVPQSHALLNNTITQCARGPRGGGEGLADHMWGQQLSAAPQLASLASEFCYTKLQRVGQAPSIWRPPRGVSTPMPSLPPRPPLPIISPAPHASYTSKPAFYPQNNPRRGQRDS
jgi:hypothetical protein